ncbi:tocopherol cyclase family protein [Pseudoduganella sp. RAF53_2]|uniref:tocopherol cyclase family protein n=1 Tax=unclassified Pseudoduganella TaxID=2637179 RepID=UPI003F99066E
MSAAFVAANRCRYVPGPEGHYESWFQRANHPGRPLALWLRYTLFQPPGRPDDAVGEVWAIYFDGERQRIHAARQRVPLAECTLGSETLTIGSSTLSRTAITGNAAPSSDAIGAGPSRFAPRDGARRRTSGGTDDGTSGGANGGAREGMSGGVSGGVGGALGWALEVGGGAAPLLLLPRGLYETRLPAAKALVTVPDALFTGTIDLDGRRVDVQNWRGSLNHNWGRRHTDHYAWGQVAGFDNAPDVFLECATARLRFGGIWTPAMTLVVLRIGSEELRLNSALRALRTKATLNGFDWRIEAEQDGLRLSIRIHAPQESFAGLRYDNPGRPQKICLNSKLAACELTLRRRDQATQHYRSAHGAAFEILTDGETCGVPILL